MRALPILLVFVLSGCYTVRPPQTPSSPPLEVVVTGTYDEVWQRLLDLTTATSFVPQRTAKESGVLVAEYPAAPLALRERWLDCGAYVGGENVLRRRWSLMPVLSALVLSGEGDTHTIRIDVSGTATFESEGSRQERPCVSRRSLEEELATRLSEGPPR